VVTKWLQVWYNGSKVSWFGSQFIVLCFIYGASVLTWP